MKLSTSPILALAALLAPACASSDVLSPRETGSAGATHTRIDDVVKSAPQRTVLPRQSVAVHIPTDTSDKDVVAPFWLQMDEVESLMNVGEIDAARSVLTALTEPGIGALCADITDDLKRVVAERIYALAGELSLFDIQLMACELRHDVCHRLLPEEHSDLINAKLDLAAMRYNVGNFEGALALEEHVLDIYGRTLAPGHPKIVETQQTLALTKHALGDLEGALELDEAVHATLTRKYLANDERVIEATHILGDTLFEVAQYERALTVYHQLLDSLGTNRTPEVVELVEVALDLASTYEALGDQSTAQNFLETAQAAIEARGGEDPWLQGVRIRLVELRAMHGDFEGALEIVASCVERLKQGDSDQETSSVQSLTTMSDIIRKFGGVEESMTTNELVLEVLRGEQGELDLQLVGIARTVALDRARMSDLDGALELLEDVLSMLKGSGAANRLAYLDLLGLKATILAESGSSSDATTLLSSVIDLLVAEYPEAFDVRARAALSLHDIYQYDGDTKRATLVLEELRRACSIAVVQDPWIDCSVALRLGAHHASIGDARGAVLHYSEAVAIATNAVFDDTTLLQIARIGLAGAQWDVGEVESAVEIIGLVRQEMRGSLDPAGWVVSVDAGLQLALWCSALIDGRGGAAAEGLSMGGRVITLSDLRQYVAQVVDETHSLAARIPWLERQRLVQVMIQLANVRRSLGDLDGWRDLVVGVLDELESERPSDDAYVVSARFDLLCLEVEYVDYNEFAAGLSAVLSSVATRAADLMFESPRATREGVAQELVGLQLLAYWSDWLESNSGLDTTAQVFDALECLRVASAASVNWTSLALLDADVSKRREELARAKLRIAEASHLARVSADKVDTAREQLVALAHARDECERELRRVLGARGVEVESLSASELSRFLGQHEAHVSFWSRLRYSRSGHDGPFDAVPSVVAFVITPGAHVQRIELGPKAPIDAAIERWRVELGKPIAARGPLPDFDETSPSDAALLEAGAALRALVLDPIFAAAPDATELRCVLDDSLFLVPFDALPLGDGLVGERYTIRVGTTARQLEAGMERAGGEPSLLVVGGVDYVASGADVQERSVFVATPPFEVTLRSGGSAQFPPLVGAELEVERVGALFEESSGRAPVTLTGAWATKAALVERVDGARYLHIATHGWFTPEDRAVSMLDRIGEPDDVLRLSIDRAQDTIVGFLPETLCGIALAGAEHGPQGILTAEELGTLDLTNCELAVLSACETNVGIRRAGQGIQSLQTSLHAAGVRTAITSLWRVSDAATLRLFEIFYTKLWKDELGPADALWQAKMALRDEGYELKDWAGWVLTGDPD